MLFIGASGDTCWMQSAREWCEGCTAACSSVGPAMDFWAYTYSGITSSAYAHLPFPQGTDTLPSKPPHSVFSTNKVTLSKPKPKHNLCWNGFEQHRVLLPGWGLKHDRKEPAAETTLMGCLGMEWISRQTGDMTHLACMLASKGLSDE